MKDLSQVLKEMRKKEKATDLSQPNIFGKDIKRFSQLYPKLERIPYDLYYSFKETSMKEFSQFGYHKS